MILATIFDLTDVLVTRAGGALSMQCAPPCRAIKIAFFVLDAHGDGGK